MLCRFLENGMLCNQPNEYHDKLVIHVVAEHRLVFLYENGEVEVDERDYKILRDMYKIMHVLKIVAKCANSAYVSEIVESYKTTFNDKSIYDWIKHSVKQKIT